VSDITPQEWAAMPKEQRGSCILTANARKPNGYGRCQVKRFGGIIYSTHILAWVDAHEQLPPPSKPCVLHHCDNPPCCNPDHLFVGTRADNAADMIAKGRHYNQLKDCCPACGGPLTPMRNGRRRCRACHIRYCRDRWRRRNAASS
jgi:hypothetical protein